MVQYCWVPFCKSKGGRPATGKLAFHNFPHDPKLRKLWLEAVSRYPGYKHRIPSNFSVVCNKHFLPSDYSISTTFKRLLPNTVPTVFADNVDSKKSKSVSKRGRPSSPSNQTKNDSVVNITASPKKDSSTKNKSNDEVPKISKQISKTQKVTEAASVQTNDLFIDKNASITITKNAPSAKNNNNEKKYLIVVYNNLKMPKTASIQSTTGEVSYETASLTPRKVVSSTNNNDYEILELLNQISTNQDLFPNVENKSLPLSKDAAVQVESARSTNLDEKLKVSRQLCFNQRRMIARLQHQNHNLCQTILMLRKRQGNKTFLRENMHKIKNSLGNNNAKAAVEAFGKTKVKFKENTIKSCARWAAKSPGVA